MDVRMTMVPEEIDKAADDAVKRAADLAVSLAGTLTAMHVAASLNITQTSQALLQYGAQITTALQRLVQETQTQADLLRKSKEETVRTDQFAANDLSGTSQQISAVTIDT